MSSKIITVEPRMSRLPPFTVEVSGCHSVPGETVPRRNSRFPDKLLSQPEDGISTVFDIVQRSAQKFGDKDAMGSRKLIKKHHEIKKTKKVVDGELQDVEKTWTYFELSGYTYLTFRQHETLALQLGAGLRKLGLIPTDKLHLFASTSAHWLAMAHGAMSQSMPIVTAYDTLGEEGLRLSLMATKAKAIFLETHLLRTFINILKDAKDIQCIVLNTESEHDVGQEDLEALKSSHDHLTIINFDDLFKLGGNNPIEPIPPAPDDLCCVMYTSGSTGTPKGVELRHRNVVAAITGANAIVGDYVNSTDVLLAYLPLAHILEFVFEHLCIFWGGSLGYGSPRTLTDSSCRNCNGDLKELRPTLVVGVPAMWETVKKGITTQINSGGTLVKTIFWGAVYAKQFLMSNGFPGSAIFDSMVFKKVQAATGGRLRFCMNGAAPIAKETQDFVSMTIAPLISGYGSTETTGMGVLCDPFAWTSDALGEIEPCNEIKLVDYPDAGYFASNQQGEIWIRGHSVVERYYENEDETFAGMAPGRWFRTGDIGEWDKDGHLKVIDRKKNLVKTLNGEYIALEKLESKYRSAAIVGNIWVYASATETHPIATILPAEPALKKLADTLAVEYHGIGELVQNERINREVLKQLQAVGRKAGLMGIEIIAAVVLVDEEWTPQNKLVTATLKLNRLGLHNRYKREIEMAYKLNGT